MVTRCRRRQNPDEEIPTRKPIDLSAQFSHDSAESTTNSVAHNGAPDGTADRIGHPWPTVMEIGWIGIKCPEPDLKGSAADCSTITTKGQKVVSVAESTDQADSRDRPLWRRAFTIARPALVRMRLRKPCLRARLRTFGWYVRFIVWLLVARWASSGRGAPRCCRFGF